MTALSPPATVRNRRARRVVSLLTAAVVTAALSPSLGSGAASANTPAAPDPEDAALTFDTAAYTPITVTIDGAPVHVRWYKEICYVAEPILMASTQNGRPIANPQCGYQSMNVFVPETSFDDPSAALYFAVNNSGWMASYIRASVTDGASYASATSNVGAALKAGYVFIDVAARSRGIVAADGSFPGKSPAAVVDAKAAVRYLRLNDATMPGSAERIVVNGTSGGGALTSILAASGNSDDYTPYLADIGAAGISADGRSTIDDDVLAANAYCPITDLGHADLAYEWLYTTLGTRAAVGTDPSPASSAEIASEFAAYQKSLGLTNPDGGALTVDNMLKTIRDEVSNSAEIFMKADPANVIPDLGEQLSGGFTNDWIDVDNDTNKVVSINMTRYLTFVATQRALKPVPAFDQVGVNGLTGGESNLFGSDSAVYSNFTKFGWNHNTVADDGVGRDDTGLTWDALLDDPATQVDEQVDLVDPMKYIDTSADTAPYWYVRHGTRDRDTAFTVSVNLDRALQADPSVKDANYRLAWDKPHAGNYDVPEAMAWIAASLADAGPVDGVATTLSANDVSGIYGKPTTITAQVSAAAGSPTGTVTVLDGSKALGTATLVNGTASVVVPARALGAGQHSLVVRYSGDGTFAGGDTGVRATIAKASSKVSVSLKSKKVTRRTNAKLSVRVSSPSGTPRGAVRVTYRGKLVGKGTLDRSGRATVRVSKRPSGKRTFTVTYVGTNDIASSHRSITVRVSKR